MLRSGQDLKACNIQSSDGDLGKINDFYFDDEDWVIRYLVVDTNIWVFKRNALIGYLNSHVLSRWLFIRVCIAEKTAEFMMSEKFADQVCVLQTTDINFIWLSK